jgi:hypothetical protein
MAPVTLAVHSYLTIQGVPVATRCHWSTRLCIQVTRGPKKTIKQTALRRREEESAYNGLGADRYFVFWHVERARVHVRCGETRLLD